jgi:hypothetical protein
VGLLTFDDATGDRWRVWRVDAPSAGAHLMDADFRQGWLVFEREDGSERRRLAQVPDDWESLSPRQLARLCEVSSRVEPIRSATGKRPASGQQPDQERSEKK